MLKSFKWRPIRCKPWGESDTTERHALSPGLCPALMAMESTAHQPTARASGGGVGIAVGKLVTEV